MKTEETQSNGHCSKSKSIILRLQSHSKTKGRKQYIYTINQQTSGSSNSVELKVLDQDK